MTQKDTTAPSEAEQELLSMALCAVRYCLGRQSYIVASGVKWAREYGARSPWFRSVVIEDIKRREKLGDLGMEMDRREWLAALADLMEMDNAPAV